MIGKSIAAGLARVCDRIEGGGLALQELTLLFALSPQAREADGHALREVLRRQDAGKTPYGSVPGLHTLRWVLVEGLEVPRGQTRALPSGPLILAIAHDGEAEDLLYELLERCRAELSAVLAHCAGFSADASADEYVRSLLAARVRSAYLFRDRDASRAEIQRAVALRSAFVEWFAANQGLRHGPLREAFARFRAGAYSGPPGASAADLALGYPFELVRGVETPIEREGYWVRRAAELASTLVRREARAARRVDPGAPARRGVHGFHHGCVRASCVVSDELDPRYQTPLFKPGASYDALLRFSNTGTADDRRPDGHGLAIKLFAPSAVSLLADPPPDGPTAPGTTQDFLLVDHPTFFIADAREYAVFRSIVDALDKRAIALRALVFAARRPRALGILLRTMSFARHVLAREYHSMTALRWGELGAVKLSVRAIDPPAHDDLRGLSRKLRSPHFLRETLQETLDPARGRRVELALAIHVPVVPGDPALPVEDPRVDWRERGTRRVVVAKIVIERQVFTSEEQLRLCEQLVFTPWHAVREHQALGSLNRARFHVYRASAATRAQLNRAPQVAGERRWSEAAE